MEKIILTQEEIKKTITKLAKAILKKNEDLSELAVVGIHTIGVFLAKRLLNETVKIKKMKTEIPFGLLDINLYRDDL
jgi:pyrimidine operon attenuation protein/uracil phosphoribosyltransferase